MWLHELQLLNISTVSTDMLAYIVVFPAESVPTIDVVVGLARS